MRSGSGENQIRKEGGRSLDLFLLTVAARPLKPGGKIFLLFLLFATPPLFFFFLSPLALSKTSNKKSRNAVFTHRGLPPCGPQVSCCIVLARSGKVQASGIATGGTREHEEFPSAVCCDQTKRRATSDEREQTLISKHPL